MLSVPRTIERRGFRGLPDSMIGAQMFPDTSRTRAAGGCGDPYAALAAACARANQIAETCPDIGPCEPLVLGMTTGNVAAGATGTFSVQVPVDFIPMRLILSDAASAMNVTDVHSDISGPMIFGSATNPIPGSQFRADVGCPVTLRAKKVSTSQTIFVSVTNPTANGITFTGSIEGAAA